MNKEQAIQEVARLRKLIAAEVERTGRWNFRRMTDPTRKHLEKVWQLEEEFKLPSSTSS